MTEGHVISVFHSVAEIPAGFGPSVASIGNFDGVHLGHQQILSALVGEAREQGARAVAITFDPHPEQFLRPAQAPRLLTPVDERLRLLALTGIDAVVVLTFDEALASLAAREFVRGILVDALGLRSLHEGGNFRFGHHAQAGVAELKKLGPEFGFAVHVHPPVQARGRGIGTRLLVPTVNLAAYEELLPAFGVYVTRLKIDGRAFEAVTNVGNRPTFGEASFAVESHLLDFEPVEIGPEMTEATPVELEFLLRLRGEREWPSPEALKAQIFKDVARAKEYFRLCGLLKSRIDSPGA